MKIGMLFQVTPLWLLFILTIIVVLFSYVCGSRLGCYLRLKGEKQNEAPIGAIVGATLGLLAFMLAFTFSIAASRFDVRKQLLLDEVNAIGTAILRTDFLPESKRSISRQLLKQYVDIRVEVALHPEKVAQLIKASEALHDQLWSLLALVPPEEFAGLYIQSLNEVIDLHSKRVTVALQYHIPGTIWSILYFLTLLAVVAVGYQFGIAGTKSYLIVLVLALSFSAVITLIADLDRSSEGLLKVSQKPMIELQQKLSPK
jgi:hypothetical protein